MYWNFAFYVKNIHFDIEICLKKLYLCEPFEGMVY